MKKRGLMLNEIVSAGIQKTWAFSIHIFLATIFKIIEFFKNVGLLSVTNKNLKNNEQPSILISSYNITCISYLLIRNIHCLYADARFYFWIIFTTIIIFTQYLRYRSLILNDNCYVNISITMWHLSLKCELRSPPLSLKYS